MKLKKIKRYRLLSILFVAMLFLSNSVFASASDQRGHVSTRRWASIVESYLYDNGNGTFTVLDCDKGKITISIYSNSDHSLLTTQNIEFELSLFGGFYAGEKYNYIVFGQKNEEEDDNKEVLRVVKYDKEFNRIAQASVNNCFTINPFYASSLRMVEENNILVIHTGRERYLTEDGLHHQSQLTVIIDTSTMTIKEPSDIGEFQGNHVGHSFNQFVIHDGNSFVLLDHGDAYPRSIVLHKYIGPETDPFFSSMPFLPSLNYTAIDLFEIPGEVGANCTGITLGGFECSENNYLVAMNTIDHSKVTKYTPYEMVGLDVDERNVVLLVSNKDNQELSNVKQIYLTDYIGKNKCGSTPYLVKLSNDRFLVLWEELYVDPYCFQINGVKYVLVNGDGKIISDIKTFPDLKLSSDCQPVQIENHLMWYMDNECGRDFYTIDLSEALITVRVNGNPVDFDWAPMMMDDRTLVPIRTIFEALGASVAWDGKTQTVTANRGRTTILLEIGNTVMMKNGQKITLDVPAQIYGDRTLVPARAVAEAFGCKVDWDGDTHTVLIDE